MTSCVLDNPLALGTIFKQAQESCISYYISYTLAKEINSRLPAQWDTVWTSLLSEWAWAKHTSRSVEQELAWNKPWEATAQNESQFAQA